MPKGPGYRRRKRRMKKFKLSEIGAVDTPAQSPALAAIMKRDGVLEFTKSPDETPYVLTSSNDDHAHGIWLHGPGGDTSYNGGEPESSHSHPWAWENGSIVIGETQGHTHSVDQTAIVNAIMALTKRGETAEANQALTEMGLAMPDGSMPIVTAAELRDAVLSFDESHDKDTAAQLIKRRATELAVTDMLPTEGALALEESTMPDPITPDTKALETENSELKATVARLQSVSELTDVQKAHYLSLADDAKEVFLAKSAEGRDSELAAIAKAAASADPVVYTSTDGTEFRKSDDARLITMAKRDDAREAELADLRKSNEDRDYVQRANDELSHLPGTPEHKAQLLKAVDSITDEDIRKSAHEALVAGDKAIVAAFSSTGTREGLAASDGETELESLVQDYIKANPGTDYFDAYETVASANPAIAKRAVNKE